MTWRPPFVLLDDARAAGAGAARLYEQPREIVIAWRTDDVAPALARLREAVRGGAHAAGYLTYEAGHAFEPRLAPLAHAADRAGAGAPLLWFGLFDRVRLIDPAALPLPDPAGAFAAAPVPLITRAAYHDAVARTLALIAAGDIYQANLSFRASVRVAGDPMALYARLRAASGAGWGGVVATGEMWLLSASPELFFTLSDGGALAARPMKGTAIAASDPANLAADPKQRAENLMIVDLMRNDLARVAEAGSVRVPALFEVETYPTLHQLTSTIAARLAPGRDAIDVLAALFPCGSVTGAPKIRAQEIIAGLEPDRRGPYTGSIGWLAPDGGAAFNVAIRTLMLAGDAQDAGAQGGGADATIGLGSAIVADSAADGEWRECLAKGAFVTAGARPFDLIETMRFDPEEGILRLALHLARLKASARALGFAFDRHEAGNELQAATFRLREPARVRLMIARGGAMAIEVRALPAIPEGIVTVALAPLPVAAADFRLRHKTSDRRFYDAARTAAGTFEVMFEDRQGFLTEGSFTSLFVARGDGLVTPPLARGLLPGVLREALIAEGKAIEGELVRADLANGFLIGNAVRGLIPARLAD